MARSRIRDPRAEKLREVRRARHVRRPRAHAESKPNRDAWTRIWRHRQEIYTRTTPPDADFWLGAVLPRHTSGYLTW